MYVADNTATSLYVHAGICMWGDKVDITQNGQTALDGDFVNDVTSGNVFDNNSSGWYYFGGEITQRIKGSASKQTNYINFPNVETKNQASVTLDALMGMNVDTLKLSEGRFVLKAVQDTTLASGSQLAHMMVSKGVSYTRNAPTPQQQGVVEIELYLGDNRKQKFFGWTPPYKKTYSDYIFFNYLLEPTHESLFGELKKAITDAEYELHPGRGYLIGQGVYGSPVEYEWPDSRWKDAKFEDRFTDTLVFNRYRFKDILEKSIAVASHLNDSYSGEELNTDNIVVNLNKKGYHFLGNPYTCPLDLSSFVIEDKTKSNAWGVSRGSSGAEDVYNMFWIISQGNAYDVRDDELKFKVNVSYLVGQEVGSTYNRYPNTDSYLVAPMQMFIVYANKKSDFTIPKSERKHGSVPFLRSTQNIQPDNELLLEVADSKTGGFDRACVVFRPDAHKEATDQYDATKMFNRSGGVSQIWLPTGSAPADKNLSVNVVPTETTDMDVAWLPASTPQQCTITAYRQESLTAPERVILLDRQTGIKTDLLETPAYTFDSNPQDRSDRFVLLFKSPTGIDDTAGSYPLACYYEKTSKSIKITGLGDEDANSVIAVYDVQGRKILQCPVGNGIIPFAMEGVYIVKITGNRMLNNKILVK
jgi:hypothetical protein